MYWYSTKSMIVFYEVVRNRSFTRAAENLFMTQPGVSIYIGQLESELGVKLLTRKNKNFKLTKEGKAVFKFAERIHKISTEFERFASDLKENGIIHLTIGATPTYCKCHMPNIVASFTNVYKNAQLKIEAENSDILERKLLSQEMDIVVAPNYKPSSLVWSVPFAKEELMAIVAKTHELASREVVSLKELSHYPIALREEGSSTRRLVCSYFRSAGITFTVGIEVNNTDFIREWVLQNMGFSLVSRTAAMRDERVRAVHLQEKLCMDVCVLCLKARRYEIPIGKFIQHLIN